MLSSVNNKGKTAEKIAQVKLYIQRMYSEHADSRFGYAARMPHKLNDLDFDRNLNEEFFNNEGKTIDQYAREMRVNKVKELLVYTSLSEETICQNLHYSSVNEMEYELFQQTGLRINFFQNLQKQKATLAQGSATNTGTKISNKILAGQ